MTGRLPAAFHRPLSAEAFFQLYTDRYLGYAGTRLRDRARCEAVVGQVLDALAEQWPAVLRSASPEAVAWRRLNAQVAHAERADGTGRDRLYQLLLPEQADVVILHRVMGLGIAEVSALMGIERPAAAGLLLAAERRSPAEVTSQVRRLRRPR